MSAQRHPVPLVGGNEIPDDNIARHGEHWIWSDEVVVHNLRTEGENPAGVVEFFDARLDHSLALTPQEWEHLGKPNYVVALIRAETFGESTP